MIEAYEILNREASRETPVRALRCRPDQQAEDFDGIHKIKTRRDDRIIRINRIFFFGEDPTLPPFFP